MQQETADELVGVERHELGFLGSSIIFPAELHLRVVDVDQAAVGDRHPMGVAAKIAEHLLRAAQGSLRVDDPFYLAQRSQVRGEGRRLGKWREVSEEAQRAGAKRGLQSLQEKPAVEP